MNPDQSIDSYLILGYAVGIALLWGYAILSWIDYFRLQRPRRREGSD
ncbi:MAG: hypothetical protein ACYS15_20295 [Planctomycetota bacterium]|jgi:hypothetical protein